MRQLPLAMRLRERAVFDSFVTGANAVPLQALREVGAGSARGACWLMGPPGVGKTHLLQATCALAAARGLEAAYLPLRALRAMGPDILQGWQGSQLLAIDEAASVAGEPEWERALFALYREGDERHAALLFADQCSPQQARWSLADLASRLRAATLLTLAPLDEAQQRDALRLRAHARGLELPEDAALYLQRHFRRDLPSLYELLDAIDEAALQAQRRLTLPFIRAVLQGRRDAE